MNLPLDMAKNVGMAYGSTTHRSSALASQMRRSSVKSSAVDLGFSALLKAFSPPPSVLVNARHELVHSYGDVHRFLQLREGQASLDLNRVLPDSLISIATALLYKVAREGTSVKSDTLRLLRAEGPPLAVRLSAWPAGDFEGERLLLLAFEQVHITSPEQARDTVDVDAETSERIEVLERELGATRESLQATIEELETSNEELQSTNEELMSSNEELQSSNEELQSVNEELLTVNAEYQEKIDLMNRLNADLDSMTQAVTAGTVFVDHNLHLTRFSPDAAHIFKLRDSDLGRRLDDLTHTLNYPELIHDLEHTLTTGNKLEKEVTDLSRKHYFVRMLPYSIPSSPHKGVVASFVDVTALHDVQRLQDIIDGLAEHISVLDANGVITMVNKAWQGFAQDNGGTSVEHNGTGINYLDVCKIGIPSDGITATAAAQGVREVLQGLRTHFSVEYPCHSRDEERWFVMHASALQGEQPGAVVSHINITEWRQRLLLGTP
jgi:two-component system CheB/CheR fusion protein